ncbi:excinuclease ABC subunit UvrA, partial [Candidatus Microgenomates bacterium]|nr:excinuclease ABC subunit UvrA [Candidatus Microgenomates bacterium]
MQDKIIIKGARQHNLKNIDLTLPKNKLIVFTGVSGSGKSSLAFDTVYAEGQRRYVESLSAYARQFLGVSDKPDVDSIEGLSPAISIDQKTISHNPRSTVGTVTEIYDYLRLLFARIGHPHCPSCGLEISRQTIDQIVNRTLEIIKNSTNSQKIVRIMILSPVVRGRKGEFTNLFDNLRAKGYRQIRIDNQIFNLDEELVLIKTNKHAIEVVLDRISLDKKQFKDSASLSNIRSRLSQGIEQALELSDGLVIVSQVTDSSFDFPEKPKKFEDNLFSERFACPVDNIQLPEIEPRLFSFNSPYGACATCSGLGSLLQVDEKTVLNPHLSIDEGGILPFARTFIQDTWFSRIIRTVAKENNISTKAPLGNLTAAQKKILLFGTQDREYEIEGKNRFGHWTSIQETFHGIVPELQQRYHNSQSEWSIKEIEKYMQQEACSTCQGTRLKNETLGIVIDGKSIAEVCSLSITHALNWVGILQNSSQILSAREKAISNLLLKEIETRLLFLESVGLNYLTLARSAATLSAGEAQRIRLASQIGSGLTGVLYVLDEPTIGLHPRDNFQLVKTLRRLTNLGNTVIVVEHDRDTIESSDWVVDFGPGAGKNGGMVVAQGTLEQIIKSRNSLTGQYLGGRRKIEARSLKLEHQSANFLSISGCSQYNLKNIDVSFPLGKLICITGVSGSGKSTLLIETLYHALARHFYPFHKENPGKFKKIEGLELIDKVILIDQSPIGRTPRSNPATYTGAWTPIRQIFAASPAARTHGFTPSRFSFNVRGGRCEACEGQGVNKIEMQFLADVYITCEVCQGKRFNNETLEVAWRGKNIADVLRLTVEESLDLFGAIPEISGKLSAMKEVGLEYIELGQSAPTLSGGEAQRVKLASELSKRSTGQTFYILDEPTTGLHFADLEKLVNVLRRLAEQGNTVCVIEHNLDVIKNADWIIDLGPEGGEKGGQIVADGSPLQISKSKNSLT